LAVTAGAAQSSPQARQPLTLKQAEQLALQNHPQVQVAQSLAAAAQAQVTEARSAYYPLVNGSVTGAKAESDSRIAAGGLNNPIIYDRFADGVSAGQLITDFGRTHELVRSSDLHAQSQQMQTEATRADVLLRVDRDYFAALKAQTLLAVAQQTVEERQLVADQISTMAQNQLRSQLDVSFANVNLAQARLLLVQAQGDLEGSFAELSYALGFATQQSFQLADEPSPASPPADVDELITQALQDRPDLASQRLTVESAQDYATAERDLWFPTISSVGAAGLIPFRQSTLRSRYAAIGFNVNVPLFNGHLFGALRSEASARAEAQRQQLRDEQDRIARDIRTTWLAVNTAFQRLSVTDQLLDQANQALDLAQGRYQLGLGSIVELSQAQLDDTQARIVQASARYDYQTQSAVLQYQLGIIR
jgi:outer membrane protein